MTSIQYNNWAIEVANQEYNGKLSQLLEEAGL